MEPGVSDVVEAISGNDVFPYFQPIVGLRTGRLTGFEVLARWQHPVLGAILPNQFIRLAEDHGLIEELTLQVFRKAFQACASLSEPLTLSVNVSPVHLHSDKLPEQMRELATETGFPLDRVIVEITESALLRDLPNLHYS